MENSLNNYSKERIRIGVLAFYLLQGLCFASWASRIPDIKDYLGVSDTRIWGLILFLIPVGKFAAIPLAGYTVSKFGSRIMVQISIIGYGTALFLIGLSANIYILGASLVLFGIFWNLTDISLNTQGIGIEKLFGRTIMASFHGTWSLAACFGALIGFVMINLHIFQTYHFTAVLIFMLIVWLINRKYLQDDTITESKENIEEVPRGEKEKKFRMPEMVLLQLGLIGLFALIVESAMFDWGGLYFESIVHAPPTLQIGFLVFMVMMTTGRFLTNFAYNRFGKKITIQIAGSFIFAGMFIAGLFPSVIPCSIGFMLVGLGISCIVPTIYSVVGEKSKTKTSIALTILSTISFIGSLIAPLLIGYISHLKDMKYAYMVIGVVGALIVVMTTFTNAMSPEKK
ncbi:Major Facilitator Superfamily protein [Dysgonomonas macrotermitis]|uniref:Major Facilitator Superfamily protein n=1 Tax=Dysgonomonas macrotermitis TaxID=1346286 RepID=A0A1M5FJ63_9BACT|nr:Major Facilitator Superfamily protein [Dysgonomonas macrotermitis]